MSALEVCSQQDAIQIHVYLYLTLHGTLLPITNRKLYKLRRLISLLLIFGKVQEAGLPFYRWTLCQCQRYMLWQLCPSTFYTIDLLYVKHLNSSI